MKFLIAYRWYYCAKTLGVGVQFFFDGLPGVDADGGLSEGATNDEFMAAMMTTEGVQLAKTFKDADSTTKRKLIVSLARLIVDAK